MNADYAIQNRNNGKSTKHKKSTSNKTIFYCAEDNNRPIDIGKDGTNNLLIIATPLFLFSMDNVVRFSNSLLAVAKLNPVYYDRWEISPPEQTFSKKIKNLF